MIPTANFKTASIDALKQRIAKYIGGYGKFSGTMAAGNTLYRGVMWADRPTQVDQLSYPPPEKAGLQRANRPGQPRFYASVAGPAAFYELKAKPGTFIALSEWHVDHTLWVNDAGYHPAVLNKMGARRGPPEFTNREALVDTPHNQRIRRELAEAFARDVPQDHSDEYKLTVAIAEVLLSLRVGVPPAAGITDPRDFQFAGLTYPTIAMRRDADNIVLIPDFVDRHLTLRSVQYVRVDSHPDPTTYSLTTLAQADTFTDNTIHWGSDLHHLTANARRTTHITFEDEKWTMRNERGEIYFTR